MDQYIPVTDIIAREILDSRGNPTVEVEVLAGSHFAGRAMVPSGASTGKYEAIELRDGKHRYQGLGVRRAVEHVNDRIIREILGMNVLEQAKPINKMFKGWRTDLSECRTKEELPVEALAYIAFIEEAVGVKIKYVSVGAKRDQYLVL